MGTLLILNFFPSTAFVSAFVNSFEETNLKRINLISSQSNSIYLKFCIRMIQTDQEQKQIERFRWLYRLTHLVGLILLILLFKWIGLQSGFSWHPILMTVAMVFLYGNCKFREVL